MLHTSAQSAVCTTRLGNAALARLCSLVGNLVNLQIAVQGKEFHHDPGISTGPLSTGTLQALPSGILLNGESPPSAHTLFQRGALQGLPTKSLQIRGGSYFQQAFLTYLRPMLCWPQMDGWVVNFSLQ